MLSKLNKDNKGFTIIEVLIVLAIAGLIMLIVFLAIPALQRNQRNNARNSEASRISSAVNECLSNRNGVAAQCGGGAAPVEATSLANLGIVRNGDDDGYNGYQQFDEINFVTDGTAPADVDGEPDTRSINISFSYKCSEDGSSASNENARARDYVVMYKLEPNVSRCIGSEANSAN